MAKLKEDPVDLQRQKEDIENLLSSLEVAFAEGNITQEHYNEVKQKNAAKLEEVKKKLKQAEKQTQKEVEKLKAGKIASEKAEQLPKEPLEKEEVFAKEEKKTKTAEVAPKPTEEKEEHASEEKIKEKIIMELSPKIEKMNIRIVKLKAFIDALKEDKTGERETSQRLTEEVGEARSALSSIEGRLGEIELKVEDVTETLADLKPQRFLKELQKKEEEIKMHEARIEKLDEINSTILKRVNQIQIVLEKLGNIESIAEMTKDISKKIVSIDDREKKVTRLADKIENMFVEVNKRLEEFMFYKAKQDSLDDLSKEMLKSLDELTTKLARYAEKDDLELLRDTLENRISTTMKEMETPGIPRQSQQERSEVESLMGLLEEQFKKGLMSKKDYEKAKEANVQKLKAIEKKKSQIPVLSLPTESREAVIEQKPPVGEKTPESESGLSQAAKIAQPPESSQPMAKKEETTEKKEPVPEQVSIPKQPKAEEKPIEKKEPIPTVEKPAKPLGKKERMLSTLEDSFRKGLISQKAYETARETLIAKKL